MRDFLTELHWFNFPDLKPKIYASWLRNLMLSVSYDIRKFGKPTFIYQHNNHITELDEIIHNPEAVEYLNTYGIDFYLNEPLCLRTLDQESVYDNVIQYDDFDLRAAELDSIKEYIVRNKLTNLTVYVGDYNIEKYAKYYEPYMKLVVEDIFFYSTRYIVPNDTSLQLDFTHKFVNLNGRYTHYRHILASYLKDKSALVSWFHDVELPIKTDWYDLSTWDNQVELNSEIGIHIIDEPYEKFNQESFELEKVYAKSFCDIIGESRFTVPLGNISEKTLRPIMYRKPFILAAPYKTLEYLKTLGFKTFSDFWDESYDECKNHEERLKKVLTLIDYIDNMSLNDLRVMLKSMEPILDHNFQIYKKNARFGQDKS